VAAWDRQPGEPSKWFRRFEKFTKLGPSRIIATIYQAEEKIAKGTKPTFHWYKAAEKWKWRERAEAYDAHQAKIDADQEAADRRRDRELRRKIIRAGIAKAAKALASLGDKAGYRDVMASIVALMREQRAENDEQPTQRHDVAADIGLTWEQLLALTPEQRDDVYEQRLGRRLSFDVLAGAAGPLPIIPKNGSVEPSTNGWHGAGPLANGSLDEPPPEDNDVG
jgi:hypothetical protein